MEKESKDKKAEKEKRENEENEGREEETKKSEVIIELIGVKKSFGNGKEKVEVLKGVDLKVFQGEKIAIVGASGSGKTTLLSIIGTILKPDEGKVILDGENVVDKSEKELEKIRGKTVSFVFQNGYLIEELSVIENVEMFAVRVHGEKKGRELALKILNDFKVPERKNVWELSRGEYQRVALARALAVFPKILLADEPTGNLDPQTAVKVIHETLNICEREKITLVLVTHNLEIAQIMDKTFKLENGRISEIEIRG